MTCGPLPVRTCRAVLGEDRIPEVVQRLRQRPGAVWGDAAATGQAGVTHLSTQLLARELGCGPRHLHKAHQRK